MTNLSIHQTRTIELVSHMVGRGAVRQRITLLDHPQGRLMINDMPASTLPEQKLKDLLGVNWMDLTDTYSAVLIKTGLELAIEHQRAMAGYEKVYALLTDTTGEPTSNNA